MTDAMLHAQLEACYFDAVSQADWPGRLAGVIAGEVRRYRDARKMSARELAERCTELGMDIPQAVIANLENKRRPLVSVAELLVLARALEVPPLRLLFPLGYAADMEILPDVMEDTWVAAKHFIGENGALGVVDLFRDHEHYLGRFLASYREVVKLQDADLMQAGERYEQMRREDLPPLRRTRQMIRAQGLTPPPLPERIPEYLGIDQ